MQQNKSLCTSNICLNAVFRITHVILSLTKKKKTVTEGHKLDLHSYAVTESVTSLNIIYIILLSSSSLEVFSDLNWH